MKSQKAVSWFTSMVLAWVCGLGSMGILPGIAGTASAYEVVQDAPLVVLARLVSQKKAWLKKLGELSVGTNDGTDPSLDLTQVVASIEKAVSQAREGLLQNDNEALVAFKYASAKAKLAIARSTFSRSIAPVLASGNLSPSALGRIEDISEILEQIYGLFTETP